MSITFEPSLIAYLKEQFDFAQKGAHRVIISDVDPEMLARLDDAFTESPMLDCQQSSWRLDDNGDLLYAILFSIQQGVNEIVLSGNSLAFSSAETDGDDRTCTDSELYDRGVVAFLARHAAQMHFASQVDSLLANPQIESRVTDQSLKVTSLFYLSEADMFMVYSAEGGEFEMLA